jgi:phenylpropionate dioxygenase-like ring-hydroxylating dioxygenase large terminal subunit
MLKNSWYAVEFSNTIADSPKSLKILDRELVFYRAANGRIHAIDNTCIHRGAALANGWIVCPYHGWQFGADGTCLKIPSLSGTATIPNQAKMTTYPVREKYGWIWLFLGDGVPGELPTIPNFPDLKSPQLRSIHGEFHWQANYERVLENGLDFAHAPFVHAGAFGNPDRPEIQDRRIATSASYSYRSDYGIIRSRRYLTIAISKTASVNTESTRRTSPLTQFSAQT